MPNDHVMCFKLWNELYSYLIQDSPDDQTDTISNYNQDDDTGYHGYSDDHTDGEHSSHNIQYSSSFTMDTIQQRLQDLLHHSKSEEQLSPSSDLDSANQETADEHTPTETNMDNQHQVMLFTIVYCYHCGCYGSGR